MPTVREDIEQQRGAIIAWLASTGYPAALRNLRADIEIDALVKATHRDRRRQWEERQCERAAAFRNGQKTQQEYETELGADPAPDADEE